MGVSYVLNLTMKSLSKTMEQRLPPLKLYLEDVEFIVEKFRSLSPDVRISTADYTLQSASELSDTKAKVLKELSLSILRPNLALNLLQNGCTLRLVYEGDPKVLGIFEEIAAHLKSRTNLPVRMGIYMGIVGMALVFCITLAFSVASWRIRSHPNALATFGPAATVTGFVLFFVSMILVSKCHTTIIVKKKLS